MNIVALIGVLCVVESGGDAAAIGDGGKAVGILQMHAAVIQDVNRVYHMRYTPDDRRDPVKSREICRLYIQYWMTRVHAFAGRPFSYELAARIWNGGPIGWKRSATLPYWKRVQAELARQGLNATV